MIRAMDPITRDQHEFVVQAIVGRSPAYFAKQGVRFHSDVDDLNSYEVAELSLDDLPFALMRHDGTPPDETEVYLPDYIRIEMLPAVLERILAAFDLHANAVKWQRQSMTAPW